MPAPQTSAASSRSPSSTPASARPTHARRNPPQAARVQELLAHRQTARAGAGAPPRRPRRPAHRAVAHRVGRRGGGCARARATRSGSPRRSNPKEAQGLESELASLARRKSDLEDAELEVMERLEQADAAVAEQEALIARDERRGLAS